MDINLVELEQTWLERLNPIVMDQRAKVLLFPDSPKDLKAAAGDRVLIAFRSESFDPTEQLGPETPIVQKRTLTLDAIIQARSLRGHSGALALMEAVRNLTVGYQLHQALLPCYQSSGGFIDGDQATALWTYQMTFSAIGTFSKRIPI